MTEEIQKDKSNSQVVLFTDRIMDSVDMIVAKITSGSFIATLALVVTYCWIGQQLVKAIPPDKITTDFVFGFISGFSTSVMFVLKAYFDRGDNKQKNGGNGNEKPTQ